MEVPENLDLIAINSLLRHPFVGEKFEALRPGYAIVINNDDNSKSLYDWLLAEYGHTFRWEPLESGPVKWRIKIIKSQGNNEEDTIGNIVSRDYRKSQALQSLGIDFSCSGNKTLRQVLTGKELSMADVLRQWKTIDEMAPDNGINFLGRDMVFLTQYIIQLHHRFVNMQTRFVSELAFKVAASNSLRHPEIKVVADLFAQTGKLLETKGQKEENELFPYIIALSEASKRGTTLKAAEFENVFSLISSIKIESEKVVADLRQIRQLTNNYVAPAYTSSTCPILYKLLAAYEEDAHLHLHLENNILFPMVIQTESILRLKNQIT